MKMKISDKLNCLREKMSRCGIDTYIVPTCDFHGSENIGEYFKTRQFLTGFTGSAGTAVVTMKEALLWTDGRYFIQAEKQLENTEFVLMKSGEKGIPTIKEYLKENAENIGFDGRMMSAQEAESYVELGLKINPTLDLIGDVWQGRPEISSEPVWILEEKYAGKPVCDKLSDVRLQMREEGADVLLLTALDEVAWSLNLRGNDIAYSPVFMAFMAVMEDECILFAKEKAFSEEVKTYLKDNYIILNEYHDIYSFIEKIHHKKIWLDKTTANFNVVCSIDNSNEIINKFSPVLKLKAVKNPIEIENTKKAHVLDGIAMTKFLYWLKSNVGKQHMDELLIGDKLEEFRSMAESYIEPSFAPIVGYKEHGAIVHYSATKDTNYEITNEGVVLIDSGGHYLEGTTDITRTISLGKVNAKMKKMYTTVLKGHLQLASAVFKRGCSGVSLDYLARNPLWDLGMDYNHGTGHGVGYLLNVHESPNGIRYKILENTELNPVLEPGMITSNEPGVYLEGEFGVRIENLIVCQEKESNEYGDFLSFENLTLVPYDAELIDKSLMSEKEIKLLENYHKKVYETISPFLEDVEKEWLKSEICC